MTESASDIVGYEGVKQKALVVDDFEYVRSLLTEVLDSIGFITENAVDGVDALVKCKKFIPDLILMDLVMPRLDGLEAIRRIRKNSKLTKQPVIIVISAYITNLVKLQCLKTGANDIITKPVENDVLLEKIKVHLHLKWKHGH